MILKTTPESQASGMTAEIYDDDTRSLGYVTPQTKVMALNPVAARAFDDLLGAIRSSMELRRYELVTLAAARAIGSTHCMLAHGAKSLKVFTEDEVAAIAKDFRNAGLTPPEVAMMEYAEKLSRDASSMTDADSLVLRNFGFTDREILDITLAAAARNYLSRAVLALAVDVDVPPALSPGLQEVLLGALSPKPPQSPN